MRNSSKDLEAASQERKKVGMLVPPPILLVAIGVASAAIQWLWFGPFNISPIGGAFGLLVVLASICLFAACGERFKKAGTPYRPVSPTTAIVSSGPYRFSRNPMYVAMAAVLAGLGVLLGSWVFAAGLLIFMLVVHFGVVLPEERYLESLHGDTYRRYKQSVRRWL